MADGVAITPGSGATIATDDCGAAGQVQIIKLAVAGNGDATYLPASSTNGLSVDPRLKVVRIAVTPTISTTAYAAGDAIGGLLDFPNAARSSGGSINLLNVQVADAAEQSASFDIIFFDRSVTAPTDNAVYAPTNTEIQYCLGIVSFGPGYYSTFSANSVASVPVNQSMLLNGTDLFGVLVARSTPTYSSTSSLTITVTLSQD